MESKQFVDDEIKFISSIDHKKIFSNKMDNGIQFHFYYYLFLDKEKQCLDIVKFGQVNENN